MYSPVEKGLKKGDDDPNRSPTHPKRKKKKYLKSCRIARAESLRFWKNGKPLEPQTLYIWESVKRMKGLVDLFLSVSNHNPCHGTWGYEVTNKFWGTEGSTVGRRRKMEPLSLSLAKWTGLWPCLPNNFSTYGARRFHISRSEWDRVFSRLTVVPGLSWLEIDEQEGATLGAEEEVLKEMMLC